MSANIALSPVQEKKSRFHPNELACLDRNKIPHHIAIIPDGNRRWAKRRQATSQQGHREGADTLMEAVKAAKELNVKVITFYAFSTENWSRPKEEIQALMLLFTSYLIDQRDEMVHSGIKLDTIGDLEALPLFLQEVISETKQATQNCDKVELVLAFNYGSRNEMCRAIKSIIEDYEEKQINKNEINEKLVTRYLDTSKWKDPELLIRTSGECRVSNFLLWQISYSEIYIAPVLWPDFTPSHLLHAILNYQERDRRWGGA